MVMAVPSSPLRLSWPCPSTSISATRGVTLRRNAITAVAAIDTSKISPQAGRVLVRLEDLPDKSEGGVLLPKNAVKFERYLVGEVICVGKDVGSVQAGQKVMFSDINAYEVNFGATEKHCFCKVGDLLATIK